MKKFLLKLLMGTSLTASVFVFQACYGTLPEDVPRNRTQLEALDFDDALPDRPVSDLETLQEDENQTENQEIPG